MAPYISNIIMSIQRRFKHRDYEFIHDNKRIHEERNEITVEKAYIENLKYETNNFSQTTKF